MLFRAYGRISERHSQLRGMNTIMLDIQANRGTVNQVKKTLHPPTTMHAELGRDGRWGDFNHQHRNGDQDRLTQ